MFLFPTPGKPCECDNVQVENRYGPKWKMNAIWYISIGWRCAGDVKAIDNQTQIGDYTKHTRTWHSDAGARDHSWEWFVCVTEDDLIHWNIQYSVYGRTHAYRFIPTADEPTHTTNNSSVARQFEISDRTSSERCSIMHTFWNYDL